MIGPRFRAFFFPWRHTTETVIVRISTLPVWQDLEGQVAGQGEGMQELAGRTHQLVEENEQARGVTKRSMLVPARPRMGRVGSIPSVCTSWRLHGELAATMEHRYLDVLARKRIARDYEASRLWAVPRFVTRFPIATVHLSSQPTPSWFASESTLVVLSDHAEVYCFVGLVSQA